jgi:hypothetical protein
MSTDVVMTLQILLWQEPANLQKDIRDLKQHSLSPRQGFKPGSPKHDAEELVTKYLAE